MHSSSQPLETSGAVYCALSAICLLHIWKFVPETRSRTLEEIQEHWQR